MNILDLQIKSHETAREKGWWEKPREFASLIALCHSELSEALEEYRHGKDPREVYYSETPVDGGPEPQGIPIELADVLIRIADMAEHYGIDLDRALKLKLDYNRSRSHRHGGKKA
jgi:NTP pyrophosphatase (non-canonical NTP hydrolase)